MNHLDFTVTEAYYSDFLNREMGYQLEDGSLPQGLDSFKFQLLHHEAVFYVKGITEVYVASYIPCEMTTIDYEETIIPFQEAACYYIHYAHKMDGNNMRSDNGNRNIHKKMCYSYLYNKGYVLS